MLEAFQLLLQYGILATVVGVIYLVDRRISQYIRIKSDTDELKEEVQLLKNKVADISAKISFR